MSGERQKPKTKLDSDTVPDLEMIPGPPQIFEKLAIAISKSNIQTLELPKEFSELQESQFARIPKFLNTDDELIGSPAPEEEIQDPAEDQCSLERPCDLSTASSPRSLRSLSPSQSSRSNSPEMEMKQPQNVEEERQEVKDFIIYSLKPNRPRVYLNANVTTTKCYCQYCNTVSQVSTFSESLNVILRSLIATASESNHGEWKSFWVDYQDFFIELLAEGHGQLVRSLFQNLTYPLPVARDLLDLSQASYRAGRSDDSKTLRMSIRSLIDSMKTSVKNAEQETLAHYKNLSEFSTQVTRASSELASSVAIIEKMITQTSLKNVTTPLPQKVITTRGHSLTKGSTFTSHEIDDTSSNSPSITQDSPDLYSESLVQFISLDGTYSHKYLTIRVLDRRIASMSFKDDRLKPLKVLTSRLMEVAGAFLNKDLELLLNHFVQFPYWLQPLVNNPGNDTKNKALDEISYIKIRPYQWKKAD